MVDHNTGGGPHAEVELVVQARSGVVVPDRVVVPWPGSRDLVVKWSGRCDGSAIPALESLRCGRELDGDRQAHEGGACDRHRAPRLLIVEDLLELVRVRCRRVAFGPFLPECLDGLTLESPLQRDALLSQQVLDVRIPGHDQVRGELALAEEREGLDGGGHVGGGGLCRQRYRGDDDCDHNDRDQRPGDPPESSCESTHEHPFHVDDATRSSFPSCRRRLHTPMQCAREPTLGRRKRLVNGFIDPPVRDPLSDSRVQETPAGTTKMSKVRISLIL